MRQLANVLERALIVVDAPSLGAADVRPLLTPDPRESERERIRGALLESGGDRRTAARRLGMSYRTLLRRISEHDLGGFPQYRS